jgi:PAS domain S-box-containing protein
MTGFILYRFQVDYRTVSNLWKARLSAEARYHAWALRISLRQSRDDAQVLADFVPTGKLLFQAKGGNTGSLPTASAQEQVVGLFENYRRVYEYAAIYLIDDQGRAVVQRTNSAAWLPIIQSPKFQAICRAAVLKRSYQVDLLPVFGQEPVFSFVMPVPAGGAANQKASSPLGVVAILSPVSMEILPLLTTESVPTRTGETMLLQLTGGMGRYASPQRFRPSRQSDYHSRPDTLLRAASSAVEDHTIFQRFIDYRGTNVMASLQKIPELSGVVVSKVDNSEAFADVMRTTGIETVAWGAAVLAYAGMILLRRRSAVALEMKKTEASLRADKETLEDKVAERTTQLATLNEQLLRELAELKRAEEALALQAQLINLSNDAIITTAPDGVITGWNAGATEMYGWTEGETVGKLNRSMLMAGSIPVPETNERLRSEGRWDGEVAHVRRSGEKLVADSRQVLSKDESHCVVGTLEINRDITDRKLAEENLRCSYREKVALLQEVHHRVKNNLQIISSLLSMQANSVDQETAAKLADSERRVRSMAMIHQQLYEHEDMSSIDLADYARQLAANLFSSCSPSAAITYRLEVSPITVMLEQAIPCGLILNELITNSLKYAYPNSSGQMLIRLSVQEDQVCMTVSDQGVGMPGDFNWETSKSLGLKLVLELSKQLDGQLEIGTPPGASFTVRFPTRAPHPAASSAIA